MENVQYSTFYYYDTQLKKCFMKSIDKKVFFGYNLIKNSLACGHINSKPAQMLE